MTCKPERVSWVVESNNRFLGVHFVRRRTFRHEWVAWLYMILRDIYFLPGPVSSSSTMYRLRHDWIED